MSKMKIIFVWTGVTGYMGDCWRALAAIPDVKVRVLVEESSANQKSTGYRAEEAFRGLDYKIIFREEKLNREKIKEYLLGFEPDLIGVVGWRAPVSRFIGMSRAFRNIPKWLIFDLPFVWSLKKIIAPFVLWPYLRQYQKAFVPGERAARYARHLRFKESQIIRGLFSINVKYLHQMYEKRMSGPYPKRFLYIGRYAPEKKLDVLVDAYSRYRKRVKDPWPLDCYGKGSEEYLIQNQEGVEVHSFVQPREVPDLYASHGAFLLASSFDPWPLVLAESVAAGLPVVCTEVCGNRVELIRENGWVCPVGDAEAMANAMVEIHEGVEKIPERVQCGFELIKPYSCEEWAKRVVREVKKALEKSQG